jgi:hypothetical protein
MKMKKCTFFHEETNYLGFVINSKGVKPDPQKVEAIRTLPVPKYCKDHLWKCVLIIED